MAAPRTWLATPAMLDHLARLALRWPRQVVFVGVIVLFVALPFGATVEHKLLAGGFYASHHESSLANDLLEERFSTGPPNVVLQVFTDARNVDDAASVRAGRELTGRLATETGIDSVASYWTTGDPALSSRDGRSALILLRVRGNENDVRQRMSSLYPTYAGRHGELTVRFGGQPAAQREIADELRRDLVRAELLAAPLLLIILLFVFRSVVASLLPLALGAFSVASTLIVLSVLARITEVSVFALNMTSALGLGLAIDYSLFILTRYREEMAAGRSVSEAIVTTVRTAGRTVVFSGLTVAICLTATLIFPLYYLRSFAYAGITVVLLSVLSSVLLLPALLVLLRHRIEFGRLTGWLASRRARVGRQPAAGTVPLTTTGDRFWSATARVVLRHRLVAALAGTAVLIVLALPFAHARFALPDDRVLPEDSEAHQVTQALRDQFQDCIPCAIPVVAVDARTASVDPRLAQYAANLSAISGVDRVDSAAGSYRHGQLAAPATPAAARFSSPGGEQWISVQPEVKEPYSAEAVALVRSIRATPAPFEVRVGGLSAHMLDTQKTLQDRLPLAVAWIALVTFVLLLAFTASLLIPLQAIVLSTLSLTAAFGAMVFVFQQGHLRWLVGDFQVSGLLEETTPLLMFFVAFGMSMDYELFLLSRIKESYDRCGDNTQSVVTGLGQTGRLVTSAAACMVVVLLAFSTSGISVLKMLGLGLALAIIADATLVRGVLVPAFMGLAGRWNWWAPGWLRRLHQRWHLDESRAAVPTPR